MRGITYGLLSVFLVFGCAKERPVKHVIDDSLRVQKSKLEGTYFYLRSVLDTKYTAGSKDMFLPSGVHMASDSLIQFVIKKEVLEVTSVDPFYNTAATAKHNAVLLSFPIRHVDILRKQNPDGTDTHEEEETTARRPWNEREYVVVDTTKNNVDLEEFQSLKSATALTGIQVDSENNPIGFKVEKTLKNDAVVIEKYSFLKFEPSGTYEQRLYPRDLQQRFGLFKTRTYQFDKYGRALQSLLVETMNRWDTSKKVVYYLSKNFPEHLKPTAFAVFRAWNQAFVTATGRDVLELRENSGQEPGDLRYSMVVYNSTDEANGLLGYGPSVANPRTGEIIKADVFLYGGTLNSSIYREKQWLATSTEGMTPPPPPSPVGGHNLISRIANFLTDPKFASLKARLAGFSDPVKEALSSVRSPNGTFNATAIIDPIRARTLRKGMEFTTELGEDTLSLVSNLTTAAVSDAEIEIRIFGPLLSHELGHTLGLRHNFMGSADHAHYQGESKSSSVMDYGFLSTEEPIVPGPYDVATIQVAYGNGKPETLKTHLAQNYLYCTDQSVLDSTSGLCLQHDSGSSLTHVAKNQVERYFRSYNLINRRNDRLSFPKFSEYKGWILSALIPLRLIYDHANAILEQGGAYAENASARPSKEKDRKLWILLKQRAEASPGARETRSVELSSRVVQLDVAKLREAVKDAKQARTDAFLGLRKILMDNVRPDRDEYNGEFNELLVRGVLVDKVYALLLLMMPTADPALSGNPITVFDKFHEPMSQMLSDLISNTALTQEGLQLGVMDINLRYVALDLIKEFSSIPSLSTGEMLDLVKLHQVVGQPVVTAINQETVKKLIAELENLRKDLGQAQLEQEFNPTPETKAKFDDLQKKVIDKQTELSTLQVRISVGEIDPDATRLVNNAVVRAQIIELMVQMEITGPTEEAQKKVGELYKALMQNNIAQVGVSDGRVLKAPLTFSTFGKLETASGRLLFFNVNLIEDRAKITRLLMGAVDVKLAAAKKPQEIKDLQALKSQLEDQLLMLERYVASEKRFVQRLYDVYKSSDWRETPFWLKK